MPCFSLLKGLETQPWLDLCDLFISFQAGLCKLIHRGWAKEAREAGEANTRTENEQCSPAPWRRDGGMKLWGLVWWGRSLGSPTAASPTPSRSPALALAPRGPTLVSSYLSVLSWFLGKRGHW